MCRSIKTLRGSEPPAREAEFEAAARQYVRKVSGYRKPSAVNREAFEHAVDEVARVTGDLLGALDTTGPSAAGRRSTT